MPRGPWCCTVHHHRPERCSRPVRCISFLANVTNLPSFYLRGGTRILKKCRHWQISPIYLTLLSMKIFRGVKDISLLANLINLTSLRMIAFPAVKVISPPLANLTNLTSLSMVAFRAFKDILPLAGMSALTSLDMSEFNTLENISPLASLSYLAPLKLAN